MKKRSANFFVDLLKVGFSNIFALFSGVLLGLVLPKIAGIEDYGYYRIFTMYVTYVGLFHFGICDGCYLYFSGKKIEEIQKEKLHSLIVSLISLEGLIMIIGAIISLFSFSDPNYKFIFIMTFIYMFFANIENMFVLISQATKLFNLSSLFNSLKAALNCLWVVILYIVYKISGKLFDNYYLFIILFISTVCISDLCYIVRFCKVIFSKGIGIKEVFSDLKTYLCLGFPLMIANLSTSIIILIDRQIVSFYYPVDISNTFAYYSFAYSMLNLIANATNSISVVLYPYMKNKEMSNLKENFFNFCVLIIVFVSLALSLYFPLEIFVNNVLAKYSNSLPIFKVILPSLLPNVLVTIIMHNYFKVLGKEKSYLFINIFILILKLIVSLLIYNFLIKPYFSDNPIALSVSSLIVMFVWYFITEIILLRLIKFKHLKNDIFIILITGLFYLISYSFNAILGFIIYLFIALLLIVIYYGNDLYRIKTKKDFITELVNRR